jgi:hypothetical protein
LSFPSFERSILSQPHLLLAGFDGAKEDALPKVLHEIVEENKGNKLTLKGFRSLPFMEAKDANVSPLHVISDLKGVLVEKDYFKISHFLLPSFNLAQGPTLLDKRIVPKPTQKELFLRCLE